MMWPFSKKPDAILTDADALDALLENDDTRAAVLTFIVRAELRPEIYAIARDEDQGLTLRQTVLWVFLPILGVGPKLGIPPLVLAMAEGLDRDAALLLCALAARLDGAR